MAYEMLQPYPVRGELGNELFACEGDGSYKYGMSREGPRLMRTVLAQYWRGSPLARYMAARRRPGTSPEVRTMDFLWEEPPDEPLGPGSFPLSHCAKGIGRVYARSDWTADATWFRFECGDFWCNHQHYEVGNFEIFCREPLATESGEYYLWGSNHEINYLIRTIAHNCLLVYQPGEAWTQMRDLGKTPTANDGGQINQWGWISQTLDEWLPKRDLYHRGDLVAYDNRPEFLFVAGDCTPAYAETKLALWIRQIVFLRPGTFVIFDRVESTRPEYDKTWLLHMAGEPAINGDEVIVTRGPSRLVSRTLLPEKAIIRKVHGYTYRGQTFEAEPSSQSDVAPKWRIEVRPPEPRTDDLFLHVMFTGEPKPVELVRRGDAVGARVGDAEVLFKGKVGGSLGLGGRKMRLKAGLKLGKYET
jgi:heparin/heparan-sulfate lyase